MNLPKILLNPNKFDFSLDDIEVSYLQDAKKDFIKKYYNYSLQSLWKAVRNNLKRRIELYGSYEFLQNIDEDEKNRYFREDNTISEKLSLLNNLVIIKTCLKLGIINEKSYTVLNFFYWFSKNSDDTILSFDEVKSIITLLEVNLFKIDINFKVSILQTQNHLQNQKTNLNRRKEDIEKINPTTPKRRKSDFKDRHAQTNKVKKEDILFMQQSHPPRRRKDDFLHSHDVALKRRKDDWINQAPKRRKDDIVQTPKRRKEDLNQEISENPFLQRRRRKDDYINETIPNPRRRRKDD